MRSLPHSASVDTCLELCSIREIPSSLVSCRSHFRLHAMEVVPLAGAAPDASQMKGMVVVVRHWTSADRLRDGIGRHSGFECSHGGPCWHRCWVLGSLPRRRRCLREPQQLRDLSWARES